MQKFRLKSYVIKSDKLKKEKVRLHFLSDLHGLSFECPMGAIRRRQPDIIVIGGDMVTGCSRESLEVATRLVEELCAAYPVYYALGNHEQKMFLPWEDGRERNSEEEAFYQLLKEKTVLLDNSRCICQVKGEKLEFSGLTLNRSYYRKPFPQKLRREHISELLGGAQDEGVYQILLAHNPYHGDAYFAYGSDLILSGHYHGGVWRFGENRGLISTHFHPLPRYCCGHFERGRQDMIVSGGLGGHTVRIRIRNPREIIEVDICPGNTD